VTTRFPAGSIGVAAPGDCSTAVCILYDTKLNLENISKELQIDLGVREAEQVTFARLQHGAYRDGVRFGNGRELSLQLLGPASASRWLAPRPPLSRRRPRLLDSGSLNWPNKAQASQIYRPASVARGAAP
jgi:hypothetical protein